MTGYERFIKFIKGEAVDHMPFCASIGAWSYCNAGESWEKFAMDLDTRVNVIVEQAKLVDVDIIASIAADSFDQVADLGQKVIWVDDAPRTEPLLKSLDDIDKLEFAEIKPGTRRGFRVEAIRRIADQFKGKRYIFGNVMDPFTDYCNARDLKNAMHDMKKNPDKMIQGVQFLCECTIQDIDAQLEAGAAGIVIAGPTCSLASTKFYAEYLLPLHKKMVDHIHEKGVLARL